MEKKKLYFENIKHYKISKKKLICRIKIFDIIIAESSDLNLINL